MSSPFLLTPWILMPCRFLSLSLSLELCSKPWFNYSHIYTEPRSLSLVIRHTYPTILDRFIKCAIRSFIHSFKCLLGFLCQTLFDVRARWTELLSSGSSYSGVDTAFIACHFCFSVGLMKIFPLSLLLQYLIEVSLCYLSCQVLPERTIPTRYSCLPLWAVF